jgi:hypothetical protein
MFGINLNQTIRERHAGSRGGAGPNATGGDICEEGQESRTAPQGWPNCGFRPKRPQGHKATRLQEA